MQHRTYSLLMKFEKEIYFTIADDIHFNLMNCYYSFYCMTFALFIIYFRISNATFYVETAKQNRCA